jgi:hypothetical protein
MKILFDKLESGFIFGSKFSFSGSQFYEMSSRKKSLCLLKTRRIFHQAQEGLCYHQRTRAQHSIDENYNVFLWDLWLTSGLKDSHIMSKKMTNEKKEDCFY